METPPAPRKPLECVLCVEDEEDIQRVIKMSLERLGGVRVQSCSDPMRAVDMARGAAPDLILLDLLMPGLDGAALFQKLRADAELAHIPVVFLTASATRDKAQSLLTLGAAGVLFKPFDARELPKQLFAIWDGLRD